MTEISAQNKSRLKPTLKIAATSSFERAIRIAIFDGAGKIAETILPVPGGPFGIQIVPADEEILL